jgi:hypothetical protein
VPQALGDEYRALVRSHVEELSRRFADSRIDYTLLNTARPLDHALFHYLTSRDRVTRTR